MTLAETETTVREGFARDVIMGRTADILADIHAPGISAAIWTRSPDADFQRWVDGLPIRSLPKMKAVIPVGRVEAAVSATCEMAGLPESRERIMLAGDAGALALILGRLLNVSRVQIRLDVASGVMCPKFHTDAVPARLLCSYRGPGSEYVPAGQESDLRRVRRLRTGAAAIFRGTRWPGAERTELLHRSPPPDQADSTRLLLVIDPVD
ncbi:DUF1826 domain-containing protein [Roseibium sp. AS2]|uniref:DUF1826 domain-containing protein n=1 Tax=Roseibium sp. AS2 TaxID=3135781 RepID=UPI00316D88CF